MYQTSLYFLLSSQHAGPGIYKKKKVYKQGINLSLPPNCCERGLMYQPSGCTVYSTDYIKKSRNSERGGDDRESIYLQLRDKGKDRKFNIGAALLVPLWCGVVWCVGVSLCWLIVFFFKFLHGIFIKG